MFDLEKAISDWKRELKGGRALEDGYRRELEEHLRDKIDDLVAQGARPAAAFEEAVRSLGRRDDIDTEFVKARKGQRRAGNALIGNYARIALRKFRRQKGFSFINLAGLSVGMACCILILLWVKDEMSFDRFHKNADRIFRVLSLDRAGGGDAWDTSSPAPLAETLVRDFPEVVRAVRVQCGWDGWDLRRGPAVFPEARLAAVDPAFFEIFAFPFIAGDPRTALANRHSVVLTESLARKFFGGESALGQALQMNGTDLRVTGVIRDLPRNSHLQFEYAFPLDNMREWRESRLDDWAYRQCATYVETRPEATGKTLRHKIKGLVQKHAPASRVELDLQPLRDIHLRSTRIRNFAVQYPNPGNIAYIFLFTAAAACILLLACVNFMNLATARYGARALEVGVRKLAGAGRADLVRQFLGESVLASFVALAVAVWLVVLALPAFNALSGKSLAAADLVRLPALGGFLAIALLTGLAAGSYPALFLSSFSPARVLKGGLRLGLRRGGALRKILVVGQFAFTIALLAAALIIAGQMRYFRNKDLGFNPHNVVSFAGYGNYYEDFPAAKQELLKNPNILSVSRCFPPGPGFGGTTAVDWEGKDPRLDVAVYGDMGDYDFLETFGLAMAEGRFFSRDHPTDADNFVLNETAARLLGPGPAVGKRFSMNGRTGIIIGVIKDYFAGPLHVPIQPKVVELRDGFFVSVKYRPGSTASVMTFLEETWRKFVPGQPFRADFLDETIDGYYKAERQTGKIMLAFAVLAVFIACLGLFGMAAFAAEQRTKEIGIRKTLGAGPGHLIGLLLGEFVQGVVLANLIAWPLAYAAGRIWLGNFAYKMTLGPAVFLAASGLALAVALLTVGFLAWKTAAADPVKCLRYE